MPITCNGYRTVHLTNNEIKKQLKPKITDKAELRWARASILVAIVIAGLFGIYPPGFVAAVVALAFGLAAASFFPAIILGIFDKRMNKQGAVAGMVVGITIMLGYMIVYKTGLIGVMDPLPASEWWFGTSPEGLGTIAMCVNVVVSIVVSRMTPKPPTAVTDMVENIRIPSGAGKASQH